MRRRVIKIEIPLPKTLRGSNENFIIAVDSSGVKVANRGEWIHHKWELRKVD